MKRRNVLLAALAVMLGFAPCGRAQNSKPTAPPVDLSGVWYPSSGSTLGAATPDNPGQQFVWLDAQGNPWKGSLPMPKATEP